MPAKFEKTRSLCSIFDPYFCGKVRFPAENAVFEGDVTNQEQNLARGILRLRNPNLFESFLRRFSVTLGSLSSGALGVTFGSL